MSRNSITTYHFPNTYEKGNWLLFNIYVHEDTKFHAGFKGNNQYKNPESAWHAGFYNPDDGTREAFVNKYRNSDDAVALGLKGSTASRVMRGARFTPRPERTGNVLQQGYGKVRDFLAENQMMKIDTSIGLYLPENISFSYGVDWGPEEMGLVRTVANAVGNIAGGVDNLVNDPSMASISGLMDRIDSMVAPADAAHLTVRMAAGMAALFGVPLDRLVDRHQKKILNKHTELHFNGVNLRQFNFTFKFYPNNVEEANHIRAITDTFKFHMHPELTDTTTGIFMLYPSQFELAFMRGWDGTSSSINNNVAKIGRVALTGCEISHGEGEYVPIRGPGWSPTNPTDYHNSYTEMKLTFGELKVLTKEDILRGY